MLTRVGLNLIYLVPGETGGMEIYARELIPALQEIAGPSVELVAFVNREAAEAGGGPWGELIPSVTVPDWLIRTGICQRVMFRSVLISPTRLMSTSF